MGEQVKKPGVEWRIRRARLLGFYYENNRLVGTLGIKRFVRTYKKNIFRKARVFDESKKYESELGWAYTLPKYRGRGIFSSLNRKILSVAGHENLYATTRADNIAVQKTLQKNGFKIIGRPYKGRITGRLTYLFVRRGK